MTDQWDGGGDPAGPIDKARANVLTALMDKALEYEFARAVAAVDGMRRRHPSWDADRVAREIGRSYARDMSIAGVAAGGLAAVPGAGLAARMAVGITAETAWMVDRTANMILAVGHCYGHDQSDFERRKFTLLRVLALWSGATEAGTMVAGGVGAVTGAKVVTKIPIEVVRAINRAFGGRILVKWATKTGLIRLGSVVPFGIGAGIGGTANYVMARGLSAAAVKELSSS